MIRAGNHSLAYLEDRLSSHTDRCARVWDALWENRPIGRIAVAVAPGKETLTAAQDVCPGGAAAPGCDRETTGRLRKDPANDLIRGAAAHQRELLDTLELIALTLDREGLILFAIHVTCL